jgi:lipopolysaccharide/colanic/teichoic acid biosynthesis glycosyltransferase
VNLDIGPVKADESVFRPREHESLGQSSRGVGEIATLEVPAADPTDLGMFHAVDLDPCMQSGAAPKVLDGVYVPTTYEHFVKRPLDVVLAGLLALLSLPIFLGLSLAIRFCVGSGVIYRQERVGRGGRRFTMVKFRTMLPDRRVSQSFQAVDRRTCHKRDDDPRHTKVGRWIRKTSLDELPQLWNVIKGDMALVGPRPELPSVVERYEPWQHTRHEIRPGLTGLWQISNRAGGLANEGVHLDLDYMQKLSLVTDCKIVLRTVLVVIQRTGH